MAELESSSEEASAESCITSDWAKATGGGWETTTWGSVTWSAASMFEFASDGASDSSISWCALDWPSDSSISSFEQATLSDPDDLVATSVEFKREEPLDGVLTLPS
ncbi:hypothetical protein KFK09_018727 [Dendrobium nobile]|uniref:Uncharacterized protein n=1 Tax=Dendrobium nobile TaxID=94219 RepID=A0A8T3AVL0_DENNO|nr:hypothetical protein KFK09_018727 [Dendrobium nobile]